jgi:hypothetical protein
MLTSRMVMLQRSLSGVDVRFVSFSVDPAHDTPDVLAAYADRWSEKETRWALLATTDASLADISSGFRVAAEKTNDEKNPILHSDLFFLVDADGFVRGVYPSDAGERLARETLVGDPRARGIRGRHGRVRHTTRDLRLRARRHRVDESRLFRSHAAIAPRRGGAQQAASLTSAGARQRRASAPEATYARGSGAPRS